MRKRAFTWTAIGVAIALHLVFCVDGTVITTSAKRRPPQAILVSVRADVDAAHTWLWTGIHARSWCHRGTALAFGCVIPAVLWMGVWMSLVVRPRTTKAGP